MLRSLYIKNVAIISRLNLELGEGLNILSGETGAGKSIIIDSLNFVLGGKADKSLIRYGEEQMSVEALFTANENVRRALAELDFEEDEELVILRTLNVSGRSEIKLNGRPTTLSVLKSLTQYLRHLRTERTHFPVKDREPFETRGRLRGERCGRGEGKMCGTALGTARGQRGARLFGRKPRGARSALGSVRLSGA